MRNRSLYDIDSTGSSNVTVNTYSRDIEASSSAMLALSYVMDQELVALVNSFFKICAVRGEVLLVVGSGLQLGKIGYRGLSSRRFEDSNQGWIGQGGGSAE